MLDLLIEGATICDGSGAPAFRGCVGVEGDEIAYVGEAPVPAHTRVPADGLVVAPGFIDPHTHYDVQVCWDRDLTPSSWFGVTTAIIGNCGVGLAPMRKSTRAALLHDLENVEGLPFDLMAAAVPDDDLSYAQLTAWIERRGLRLNLAPLVPLTPLRRCVLGDDASERAATAGERRELVRHFEAAIEAGAFGFSTDYLADHLGFRGRPLPCQLADRAELEDLCGVVRRRGSATLSVAVNSMHSGTRLISDDDVHFLQKLAHDGACNVTFLPVLAKEGVPDFHAATRDKLAGEIDRIVPQISIQPFVFLQTLKKPFKFGYYQSFRAVMNLALDEQLALYGSADWRAQARRELDTHQRPFPFARTRIRTSLPEYAEIGDQSVADLARAWACHPLDVILEIACKERLETRFVIEKSNYDPDGIAWALAQPELLVGLSDGGAHLDQLCDAKYPAVLLGRWVRDRGVLSLEEAIRKLTSMPARLFDLPRRGLIRERYIADLVVFDPQRIDTTPTELVADLPGGEARLIARSIGIHRVYVRGREILRDGELTAERPGRVLRRGKS